MLVKSITALLGALVLTTALASVGHARPDACPAPCASLDGPTTAVDRQPDLVISAFDWRNYVTVKNVGNATAGPSQVRTYARAVGYSHYAVKSLAPGQSQKIILPGDPAWCFHGPSAAARADAWDAVAESNETNNRVEVALVC